MNRPRSLSLLALTSLILSACGGPRDTTVPTVSVAASLARLVAPGTVTFTATATDVGGVSKVQFYDNGALIGVDMTAPYTASKSYVAADKGEHVILARAFDTSGNTAQATTLLTVTDVDTSEPNDSVATATTLVIGTAASGTIAGKARDLDYFKFDAAAGDMLKLVVQSISMNAASTLDPYVMILMPDGKTVLEKDDDGGAGLESEIRFNAPVAGTYAVVVTSFGIHDNADDPKFSDDKATNTYQIALTRR